MIVQLIYISITLVYDSTTQYILALLLFMIVQLLYISITLVYDSRSSIPVLKQIMEPSCTLQIFPISISSYWYKIWLNSISSIPVTWFSLFYLIFIPGLELKNSSFLTTLFALYILFCLSNSEYNNSVRLLQVIWFYYFMLNILH